MIPEIAFDAGIHENCTMSLAITSGGTNIGEITCVGIGWTKTDKSAIRILAHRGRGW